MNQILDFEDDKLKKAQVDRIANTVENQCMSMNRAMSVEEIQDMVEDGIMRETAYEVARRYITYRYDQSIKRKQNTTDDKILALIECDNEEVKQENSNKNPTVASVQRDYMAGEVSKDLTERILLDTEIPCLKQNRYCILSYRPIGFQTCFIQFNISIKVGDIIVRFF